MRRLTKFAALLSAASASLIGMAYRFAAIMEPNGHGPAKASEIRSRATRDGSFPALAKVGVPNVVTGQRPLSGPHAVGDPSCCCPTGDRSSCPIAACSPSSVTSTVTTARSSCWARRIPGG